MFYLQNGRIITRITSSKFSASHVATVQFPDHFYGKNTITCIGLERQVQITFLTSWKPSNQQNFASIEGYNTKSLNIEWLHTHKGALVWATLA